ncbi:hypothetical protein M409DRAFT_19975 [Zasmidium cellare ATCC 36951]|uniref:Centrosomin N-terminal motif 1 domain-containing protein n=1 Tax=Zasmidium cellare ATCC 36951 TaxID=1080233 RepID=A0A6A6CQX2_ZASCE|nr:uncharacterized protein M409DRAFT_19975 [Zasmidium cellare ATCC 36951]KAF2169564.1 hypothetical protein M409DRAFT_19975 [Zasmidium cellare ATCC 36951]
MDDSLPRLPSFGSVNSSSVTDDFSQYDAHDDDDRPETPRAKITTAASHFDAPTDTAIAQHVQSIQVPETVARDFRLRNRSSSPAARRPMSSSGLDSSTLSILDRPRRALTLKEQNTKIDKLTKENFDLKLKIHFLDQALQTRSDDGVKELIEKNVQLQTDLANERKESQTMRRKMREMEQKIAEQDEALAEARTHKAAKEEEDDDPTLQAEMHEEILYLRQQLDHSENQVTTLRDEVMTKELEKRKMAEHMRGMAGRRGEDTAGMKETMDMWQDLLNAETGRREQAEEDASKLRDELTTLRLQHASPAANQYHQNDRRRRSRIDTGESPASDPEADLVESMENAESGALIEQLKHENAELRRDLGAQTSMLTSRNRERERLQQEIEDLKLLQRKSDGARSLAGESIFDRSISRAHQRSQSRISDHTQVTEAEREEWDKKEGQLRDTNAELRIKYQELDRTHQKYLHYVDVIENDYKGMEDELNECRDDLVKLQKERDDALQAYQEQESEYAALKQEALEEIQALDEEKKMLDAELQDTERKLQKTTSKLQTTKDDYKGLQSELRQLTSRVNNLEDLKERNTRTIETLEQQLSEAEDELQKWEQKCSELDSKNRKLEINLESLHSEITFLREEQEGDKIKIGELENALSAAQQTIQDEQEKLREMEDERVEERQQRDILEDKSKEEVQKVLDDLNAESAKTKDEVRKLRRSLSAKEVEAGSWKQKLEELEQALRNILGDPDGTKPTLLADIEKLQRELETTTNDLERARMDLSDKDRLLRHRDGLLESTSLESRRLSDLLEKERSSRKHDLDRFEKAHSGQATHLRTIAQKETRVLELETVLTQDRRKMTSLEQQYREQLHERNNLLLALWNRLSTLCGSDWAQNHSLVNGELPSADVINKNLQSFNKNIISAVKTIEALIGSFKVRIRSIEKDLWRDYQTIEHNLEIRVRRMDAIERAVKDTQNAMVEEAAQRPQASRTVSTKSVKGSEELAKLKTDMKLLRSELKLHRQYPSAMAQQLINQETQQNPEHLRRQSSSGGSNGKSQYSPARNLVNNLFRHHSTSAVEQFQIPNDEPPPRPQPIMLPQVPVQANDVRWNHRLKELEKRLKAEREARLLDRRGARQRLEEASLENEELRARLERAESRRSSVQEESGAVSERSID